MSFSTPNYSLYAIPAMWVSSIIPHFAAITMFNMNRCPEVTEWDNSNPRNQFSEATFKKAKISSALAAKIQRCEGAQQNGFDNLPFFGVAILAGNVAGLSSSTLNTLAAAYLGSRVLYNLAYIYIADGKTANLRSVLYLSGVGICFTLCIKAGSILSKTMV